MKRKRPEPSRTWSPRGVLLVEIAAVLLWLGIALGIAQLIVSSAIIFSYFALALTIGSKLPDSVDFERRLSSDRILEDQTTTVTVSIRNESPTHFVVSVSEQLPDELELVEGSTEYLVTVRPRSEESLVGKLRANFRGHYILPPSQAMVTDELGIRRRPLEETSKSSYLTVLPPIEDLSEFSLRSRAAHPEIGAFRSGRVGVGTEFFGIRDYSPGDDLRRINWKASARSESLLSNEYEREHVTDIYLIVDLSSAIKDHLKWVVRASASIATYLLKTRNRLGLIVMGESISHVRIDSGRRQLLRVLDKLITAEPGGTGESTVYLQRLIDEMPRSEVLVVSPLDTEDVVRTMIEIGNRIEGVWVFAIASPKSERHDEDLVLKAANALYNLRRAAIISRMKNENLRVVEIPSGTSLRSAVSMMEERPMRR